MQKQEYTVEEFRIQSEWSKFQNDLVCAHNCKTYCLCPTCLVSKSCCITIPHCCCCCTGNGNWNLLGHRDGCKLVIYEPLRAIKWIYNALYAKHHPFSTKNKNCILFWFFVTQTDTCMMREKHAWISKGSSFFCCCMVRCWDDATSAATAEWNLFTGRGHLLGLACDNTQRNWLFLSQRKR